MTLHTRLSYAKSAIRIVGYLLFVIVGVVQDEPGLWLGAGFLIAAELIGILEELPGAYKGTQTE